MFTGDAARRCRGLGNEAGLLLRLGIYAGDIVREVDSNGRASVHGGAVQSAARAGEIPVSTTMRDVVR